MRSYNEHLKAWATDVAPILDDDAWRGVRQGEGSQSFVDVIATHPVRSDFPEMFHALRAYRDFVAKTLTRSQRRSLRQGRSIDGGDVRVFLSEGLMVDGFGLDMLDWLTPFGREVKRAMEGMP